MLVQIMRFLNDTVSENKHPVSPPRMVEVTKTLKQELARQEQFSRSLVKYGGPLSFHQEQKLKMFNSLVKPVLLYGSETWKMNKGDDKLVDTFMFRCLRYILKIYWPYVVSNEELVQRTNSIQQSREIQTRRWRWRRSVMCYVWNMNPTASQRSHGNQKASGTEVDRKQHGEEPWNKKEISSDGSHGMKPEEWQPIVSNGLGESRPCMPLGMKRIGEVIGWNMYE